MTNELMLMTRKIYHRNDIRPVLAGMNLASRRLLYMCLAQLARKTEQGKLEIDYEGSPEFRITVKAFSEACQMDYSAAYRQMVIGADGLMDTKVKVTAKFLGDNSKPDDYIKPFHVAVFGTGYSPGNGFVDIKLAAQLKPFLSALTTDFTGQILTSALTIPDGNASKLYLILREWVSSGKRNYNIIEVEQLKEALGIADLKGYSEYKKFKQSFWDRSVKKVVEKTEFTSITIEISERQKRKAHKVKIEYKFSVNSSMNSDKKHKARLSDELSPSEEFREHLRSQGKKPNF